MLALVACDERPMEMPEDHLSEIHFDRIRASAPVEEPEPVPPPKPIAPPVIEQAYEPIGAGSSAHTAPAIRKRKAKVGAESQLDDALGDIDAIQRKIESRKSKKKRR